MTYKVYAALASDVNSGWIWVGDPDPSVKARRTVRVVHRGNGRVIYCEAIAFDQNYKAVYESQPFTARIDDPGNSIVMNLWYRQRLGIMSTQKDAPLTVETDESWWSQFQACIHQPQVVVRIATCLAVWSVFLGFVGCLLGVKSLCS